MARTIFLPAGDEADIAKVARWFRHDGLLKAAVVVIEAASPPKKGASRSAGADALLVAAGRAIPGDLLLVADAFQSLQVARHRADYDGNYDPSRAVTLSHVADARRAVEATWSMWGAGSSPKVARQQLHAAYATFLRLAMLSSGGPKSR